jgi:hypothetical protein
MMLMDYGDRGVIMKGTKYVSHMSVRSESGWFAVNIARFHCDIVGDSEVNSRHIGSSTGAYDDDVSVC